MITVTKFFYGFLAIRHPNLRWSILSVESEESGDLEVSFADGLLRKLVDDGVNARGIALIAGGVWVLQAKEDPEAWRESVRGSLELDETVGWISATLYLANLVESLGGPGAAAAIMNFACEKSREYCLLRQVRRLGGSRDGWLILNVACIASARKSRVLT